MEGFIFGGAKSFRQFIAQVESFALTEWPILLLGETGVGKELIAQYIHRLSSRHARSMVSVNVAALPPGLFESELFGYEKGAFSGAIQTHRGLIRAAHQSTLFLDEIGDLDASLQTKLLRVLESGEIRSLGSARTDTVNLRILCATNVDIFSAVAAATFRRDLLERLSVLRLEVPPLRERVEDIPLIAHHICETQGFQISPQAATLLAQYPWPGNVRQLRNVLVRAGAMAQGCIQTTILEQILESENQYFPADNVQDLARLTLADIERQVIKDRLRQCAGNKKVAAKALGIAKSTLHEKIRKYSKTLEVPLH